MAIRVQQNNYGRKVESLCDFPHVPFSSFHQNMTQGLNPSFPPETTSGFFITRSCTLQKTLINWMDDSKTRYTIVNIYMKARST